MRQDRGSACRGAVDASRPRLRPWRKRITGLGCALLSLALPIGACSAPLDHTAALREAANTAAGEAITLVLTYHAPAANRAALDALLRRELAPRLASLVRAGTLRRHQLLLNRQLDAGTWDAMAILEFADAGAHRRWIELTRRHPAGLEPSALRLLDRVETAQVDLFRAGGTPGTDPRRQAWLVIPYEYLVPVNDYRRYLEGYVFPQTQGWIEAGALQDWAMYLARYPAGRPWTALLVLGYVDDAALERRPSVTAQVRERLAAIPAWKSIADNKQSVREEGRVVAADLVAP